MSVGTELRVHHDQRAVLELVAGGPDEDRSVRCARALLLAADGVTTTRIADLSGVSRRVVKAWRDTFEADGLDVLASVRARPGQPGLSPERVAEIVHATHHERPPDGKRWTCRSLAQAQGVAASTVQRIWRDHEIEPPDVSKSS